MKLRRKKRRTQKNDTAEEDWVKGDVEGRYAFLKGSERGESTRKK